MREVNDSTVLENGKTFEIVNSDRYNMKASERSPQSFEEIFGDLSDCKFTGNLDLDSLDLSSLKGCPQSVEGPIFILKNKSLKSLEHFPLSIAKGASIVIDYNLLKSAANLSESVYRSCSELLVRLPNVKNNKTATESVGVKMLTDLAEPIKNGSLDFKKIRFLSQNLGDSEIDTSTLKNLYYLFEKVGFSTQKFKKVIKLLKN